MACTPADILHAGLQSLARLGARVTGIDLSEESIGAAKAHAQADPQLQGQLKYRACSAAQMLDESECRLPSNLLCTAFIQPISDGLQTAYYALLLIWG